MYSLLKEQSGPQELVVGLICILVLALYPPVIFAHAHLVRSQPPANATVKQAPKAVELWFNEELEASFSAISVTDQSGQHVEKNNVSLSEGGKKLQIELEEIGSGTYTVDWKIVSADQHAMKGKFTFTVALAGPAASITPTPEQPRATQSTEQAKPPQAAPAPQSATGEQEEAGSTWALSTVRWLAYLAMMTLFGGFAFLLLVLAPSLRETPDIAGDKRATALTISARWFVRLSWSSLALLLLTALVGLVLQTSAVTDTSMGQALSPSQMSNVLTMTSYGGAWLLQVAVIGTLTFIVLLLSRRSDWQQHRPTLLWVGLIVSALMFLTPSLTGHAAAAAKEYPFAIATDWLHMVAGGIWVGGLLHLTLMMTAALSGLEGSQRLRVLNEIIPRFTRYAIASTALIALTGIYSSWMHVESFSALWKTGYGKMLLVKVLLFVLMLALGGMNTFILHPKAKRLIKTDEATPTSEHLQLARNFYRSVTIEALLGVIVLLAAAILAFLQPARQHPGMSGTPRSKPVAVAKLSSQR